MDDRAAAAVLKWLLEKDEGKMIRAFEVLVRLVHDDIECLRAFRDRGSKRQHGIVHELVRQGKLRVLQHLVEVYAFDVNVQRASDHCTPLHLALWQNQEAAAQHLLALRADPSIRNDHGEDAYGVRAQCKPIRTVIQGTSNVAELLSLVECELHRFNAIDTLTAYFRMAEMTSDYDAVQSRWKSQQGARCRQDKIFRTLTDACVAALCNATAEQSELGSLWATMIRSLAMHPDREIMSKLASHIGLNGLPLDGFTIEALCNIAWGIAKVQCGQLLSNLLHIVGDRLVTQFHKLKETDIARVTWAFGKLGHQHEAFFQAAAVWILTMNEWQSVQSISNIAWSFARLGKHHPEAFHVLAVSSFPLINKFNDQNVANTAWAFAILNVAEEKFLEALLSRAAVTLYLDMYKNHEKMSDSVKLVHWSQVYLAYDFCRRQCPNVLASMSRQFAEDLSRIDKLRRLGDQLPEEGLSHGSGLESRGSLARLDEMIAAMAHSRDEPWVPMDSISAGPTAAQLQEAVSDGAASVDMPRAGPRQSHALTVTLLKFSRSPESYRRALLEGAELQPCREALEREGLSSVVEPSGAKLFVQPELHAAVLAGVAGMQLYTSHVLVTADFEDLVMQALKAAPSSAQIRPRNRDQLWEAWGKSFNTTVSRTFIDIEVPSSLHSWSPSLCDKTV